MIQFTNSEQGEINSISPPDVYCFLLVQLPGAGEDDDSFLISLDAAKVVTEQVERGPQVLMANTG